MKQLLCKQDFGLEYSYCIFQAYRLFHICIFHCLLVMILDQYFIYIEFVRVSLDRICLKVKLELVSVAEFGRVWHSGHSN